MPILIAALLALSAAIIVLYPLLGLTREAEPEQSATAAPLADAAERERLARQALREVEFDYTLGNLEPSDYEDLRDRYENRALAALKTRYQREQELDALIERQLDALRHGEVGGEANDEASEAPAATRTQVASVDVKSVPQRASRVERARPVNTSVRDRRAPGRKGS